ncbi:hypothetical protein [Persicobacter psychrovividus]|uniref:Uncharacterized protein n=1 Tax=Persicobacter psychrovividus TaxID=387638 RepID=A0ABM7VMJ8_9BACT|nr:hypothetical protein PEPS_45180 [Persicobacter psychrovividus]
MKFLKHITFCLLAMMMTFGTASAFADGKVLNVQVSAEADGTEKVLITEVSGFGANAQVAFYKVVNGQYQLIQTANGSAGISFGSMKKGIKYALIAFDGAITNNPLEIPEAERFEKNFRTR